MPAERPIFMKALWLVPVLLAACAAPSTIETRRAERSVAYEALAPEQKAMVDTGQVRIGMTSDAVYIAWGKPSEVLESEDPSGHFTTWRYYGSFMQENRYWAYREANGSRRGEVYLERYLTSDYNSRDYVRSEIVFKDGKVLSWRTLPRPTQ
jgi:outer membrane protein assembly factor BamE (lipoprotein component of BamABCDE complex)